MKKYNYLVVGAGLFGAVVANEITKQGKSCLVIDRRNHIAGNCYTEDFDSICIHKYGAHIFHTNSDLIWHYINKFGEFNNFVNSPLANYKGKIFNLPFNMNTFYQMWGVITPKDAQKIIEDQKTAALVGDPKNLEEQAISLVGRDIYLALIKGYTEKQWGRDCRNLPASIIKRLPVRFTYDNNYFSAKHQGIPVDGYTNIIQNMLRGSEVVLNTDFLKDREYFLKYCDQVIYTGAIDEYYNYCYGELSYRCVSFVDKLLEIPNFQGVAVMNFTDRDTPYTRIIEHKHFNYKDSPRTVISYEYPREWKVGEEPYYPVNDVQNSLLFDKYVKLSKSDPRIFFGGRLGSYRYFDMDQTILEALNLSKKLHRT